MENKFKPVPFWSWNDELEEDKLVEQIEWMHDSGIGGFFMHARGGLTTPYLGEKWFSCVDACLKKAKELDMEAYAYDENGWPSGFAGGELLKNEADRDCYLTYEEGPYDINAFASYDISGDKLIRVNYGEKVLNVYVHTSVSTADILNKDVVKKFINLTHEKYKEADKYGNLRGFFTDEPQYQRWHHAYTHCLEDYFKDNYNLDIKDHLGLMFVEKDGYRDFRYKYWKAMQDLMLNSFAKQVYDWCDENGYKLTGHYVEESNLFMQMENNAGIMPFYEYEHIPGMDWLGRNISNDLAPRQLGSVATQLGKKQVLTESFAMVGWDATPEEIRHIFEWQAVSGNVSLLCHHLLPYSEWGQRKRDYPEHYSAINPWAEKDFKLFNDTVSKIGETLSKSTEVVNVAVLHPIRSCYFNYKRDNEYPSVKELEISLDNLVNELGAMHMPYHFIDETILSKHGKVDGNKLIIGNCAYDAIVFPLIYTMDANTEKMIHEFVNNGGKILLTEGKPTYVEGQPYSYDYLKSNTTYEELLNNLPYTSSNNKNIRISYRKYDDNNKAFFYIVNLGDDTEFLLNNCSLKFKKWESRMVNADELVSDKIEEFEVINLGKSFKISSPVDNYLTLDTLRYSKDGKTYSEPLYHLGIFDTLLHERYKGDLYLKYSFKIKKIPSKCHSLIENQHILSVCVNGKEVKSCGSVLEKNLLNYNIQNALFEGENEIVLKMDYFQNEDVYYALFGENVTESLVNCLAYPTTIEAIFIVGDFGVFGDFTDGKEANTVIGENFYIDDQPKIVSELVKGGFPFFRGKINLEQDINLNSNKVKLNIPGRFSLIELSINDCGYKSLMFGHEFDISNYVVKGTNNLKIRLTVSNRNLLGPFHTADREECLAVGPFTFERKGTWKEGKSSLYRDSYSFVKTII